MFMFKSQRIFVDNCKKLMLELVQAGAHGALWKSTETRSRNPKQKQSPRVGAQQQKQKYPAQLLLRRVFDY